MVQSRCKCTAIDQYKERNLTYVWFKKEQEDINLQKLLLEESIDKYDENEIKLGRKQGNKFRKCKRKIREITTRRESRQERM